MFVPATRRTSHARTPENRNVRERAGYTMMELVVSLIGASLLMVGMGSAIVIATNAVKPPGEQNAVLDVAQTSFVIADEIQSTIHVLQQTPAAIEVATADRDGDSLPDVVRYEWAPSTQTLRRSIGNQAGTVLTNVSSFVLNPQLRSVPEELGGVVSESAQTELNSSSGASGTSTWYVDPYAPIGHSVEVSHPANTAMWSVQEIDLVLRRSSYYESGEQAIIQIREATGDGLPTSNVLGETSIPVSGLSTWYRWETITFTGVEQLLPGQKICIVVLGDEYVGGTAVRIRYAWWGVTGMGKLAAPPYGESIWQLYSTYALYHRIRGTRHTFDATSHNVERSYVTGYDIEMQLSTGTSPVHRRVRLLNTPEHLSAVWRLDFNVNPVDGIDVDFDGIEDWEGVGSDPSQSPVGSQLTFLNGEQIRTTVSGDFDGLVTAEMSVRGLGSNSSEVGAVVDIPFGLNGTNSGLITAKVSRDTGGRQVVRVIAADDASGQTLAFVPNIADEFVDLRIVIDPGANQVAIWINDLFQGRSTVTQPLTSGPDRVTIGALGADAVFDFLSVRVGGTD